MSANGSLHKIRIGPAGWSYPDWEGIVYPAHKRRDFHRASYLAHFFDTIEINTTFYHPATPETVKDWIRRIDHNPEFKFTAKLWQRFTHERSADRKDEKIFKDCLAPLMSASRLGALLLQFPWSFKNAKESREYLGGLIMQFMEYPLVVEVRHSSWNTPEIFQLLENLSVGFCNIDQPVIGSSMAPPSAPLRPWVTCGSTDATTISGSRRVTTVKNATIIITAAPSSSPGWKELMPSPNEPTRPTSSATITFRERLWPTGCNSKA